MSNPTWRDVEGTRYRLEERDRRVHYRGRRFGEVRPDRGEAIHHRGGAELAVDRQLAVDQLA